MMDPPNEVFSDLLQVLSTDRRAHSAEVGRKANWAANAVAPWLRSDLIAAAVLHDIGYGYPSTGFHAIDGARFLAAHQFSPSICNLVAYHSASEIEAEVRGIDLTVYDEFVVGLDLTAAHRVIAWADMTTGPTGQTVTVEERLDEIRNRYGPDSVVTKFIDRATPRLLVAGQSPRGSMRV